MNTLHTKARPIAGVAMAMLFLGACSRHEEVGAPDHSVADVASAHQSDAHVGLGDGGEAKVEDADRYVRRVYAEHGIASPEAADAFGLASAACSKGSVPEAEDSAPTRNRAIESLEKACSSFDEKRLPPPEYSVRLFIPSRDATPEQLESLAREATSVVAHPASLTEANAAARFLIMRGEFPNQDSYGVGKEDLFLAYGMANGLRYCEKNRCGPSSFMTLAVCAHSGCEPGWNYATALGQSLGPKDMRLVQSLMRTMPQD
jgi:hypothetical protein